MKTRLVRAVWLAVLIGGNAAPLTLRAAAQADAATITIAPAKLDFGTVGMTADPPVKSVTLTNSGTLPITLRDLLTSGIDFSQTNDCGKTLVPGATCTVLVSFKPAITGPRIGTLNIFDSAAGSPHMVAVSGNGE